MVNYDKQNATYLLFFMLPLNLCGDELSLKKVIYLHFLSFLKTDIAQAVAIHFYLRQAPVCLVWFIPWLLMLW